MLRPALLVLLTALPLSSCGTDCDDIGCSPAVIIRAALATAADAPFEGLVRLCHEGSCLEHEASWAVPTAHELYEISFGSGVHTSARLEVRDGRWTIEAEVHPAGQAGYFAGDRVSVFVRDAAGAVLLEHEAVVSDKLENDACGLPCAIQRVDL
jgi:hypothetical protein